MKLMLGIAVQILLSWLLLWAIEKKNLSALGFKPSRQRLKQLAAGLLLTIPFQLVFFWGTAELGHNPYRYHPGYSAKDLAIALGYLFRSVAFEELLFRGALLYILIQKIGPSKAVLASAIAFGIYHWFSYQVLGQPVQMLIVFLFTGVTGYIFAFAFQRTGSLYLPAAIHFGIDLVPMIIFSRDNHIGPQLLIPTFAHDPISPNTIVSLLVYILYFTWFPLLSLWYFHRTL